MTDLFRYQRQQPLWSSFENPTGAKGAGGRENRGAKGHAFDSLEPGQAITLLAVSGSGIVQRIWLALRPRAPELLRALRLEMFWDGADKAAVSVPLGDFFGAGLGLVPFENALFASPEGRSFLCLVPMPFRSGARITLTNESDLEIPHLFYDVNVSLTESHADDVLYFHAHWRRENPTTLGQDFELLPRVQGHGRFLGASVYVITRPVYGRAWWGEGEVKVYLDGDTGLPSLVGTGTEDYIGSGWGMGASHGRYQGCLLANEERGRFSFYRLHIPDPIFFQDDCRVTIQVIGGARKSHIRTLLAAGAPLQVISADAGGRRRYLNLLDEELGWDDPGILDDDWCNFYRQDDWTAVAYFYLDQPATPLPPLPPASFRAAGLEPPTAAPAPLTYRPRSLRHKEDGFAFNIQNETESLTLTGFGGLVVNDTNIPPAQVMLVSMHGVARPASTITPQHPFPLPTHTTARIQVAGQPLADGPHRLSLTLQTAQEDAPFTLHITASFEEEAE